MAAIDPKGKSTVADDLLIQKKTLRLHLRRMCLALSVSLFMQYLIVPSFAYRAIGWEALRFCLIVDALISVRVLVAYLLRETGYGWRFYEGLCYTSPIWIVIVVNVRVMA